MLPIVWPAAASSSRWSSVVCEGGLEKCLIASQKKTAARAPLHSELRKSASPSRPTPNRLVCSKATLDTTSRIGSASSQGTQRRAAESTGLLCCLPLEECRRIPQAQRRWARLRRVTCGCRDNGASRSSLLPLPRKRKKINEQPARMARVPHPGAESRSRTRSGWRSRSPPDLRATQRSGRRRSASGTKREYRCPSVMRGTSAMIADALLLSVH